MGHERCARVKHKDWPRSVKDLKMPKKPLLDGTEIGCGGGIWTCKQCVFVIAHNCPHDWELDFASVGNRLQKKPYWSVSGSRRVSELCHAAFCVWAASGFPTQPIKAPPAKRSHGARHPGEYSAGKLDDVAATINVSAVRRHSCEKMDWLVVIPNLPKKPPVK